MGQSENEGMGERMDVRMGHIFYYPGIESKNVGPVAAPFTKSPIDSTDEWVGARISQRETRQWNRAQKYIEILYSILYYNILEYNAKLYNITHINIIQRSMIYYNALFYIII